MGIEMNLDGGDDGRSWTIVLIHGLWMTPLCWEPWITRLGEIIWLPRHPHR